MPQTYIEAIEEMRQNKVLQEQLNKESAIFTKELFGIKLKRLTGIARLGGTRGNRAAKELMLWMAAENRALRGLGYRLSDSDRLVKIKRS